jgi:type I restriction enzyme S subunit
MSTTNLMLPDIRPNSGWASLPLFDRRGWTRVRFGDVVENLNETERSPAEAGIDRFIAMEHLEPGSLHVCEWGNVADGTTFTRRCRPGQILFGKRRAYQRKVAVAEFDAVVSGDIYVLAPQDDRLIPELLPFLCLSERFFQHAVGTSAGSLSPRTNWSSLASFEFDLPPLDQQRRIAEILWAVEKTKRSNQRLGEAASEFSKVGGREMFQRGIRHTQFQSSVLGDLPRSWTVRRMTELVRQDRPITYGIVQPGEFDPNGVLMILGGDFTHGWIDRSKMFRVKPPLHRKFIRSNMLPNDVIICIVGATTGAAAIVPDWGEEANLTQTSARISCDPTRMQPEFMLAYLRSDHGKAFIRRFLTGSAQPRLNLGDFANFWVPVPPLDEQSQIVEAISQAEAASNLGAQAANSASVLLASLTAECF